MLQRDPTDTRHLTSKAHRAIQRRGHPLTTDCVKVDTPMAGAVGMRRRVEGPGHRTGHGPLDATGLRCVDRTRWPASEQEGEYQHRGGRAALPSCGQF